MAADLGRLQRPDVRVYQEFETVNPTLVRPLLQAAIIGQPFQLVTRGLAGTYGGSATEKLNYPGLLAGALVDDFSAYPGEDNLLDEVIVEIEDANGTFDVSADDEVVIQSSGVTLGKALTLYRTMLSATVVTTGESDTTLTFPAAIDLHQLGVRIGDRLTFATQTDELVDPAAARISSEVDADSGLPILFDVTAILTARKIRVARIGKDWSGFVGEANIQAEIRRLPAGTGTVVAETEYDAAIPASATFSPGNSPNFFSDGILPGDQLYLTSDIRNIVNVASTIVANEDLSGTTIPGGEEASTGILGVNTPILAGTTFTDEDGPDFDDAGVLDDGTCFLEFITDDGELAGSDGTVVVRNTGKFQIIGVGAESLVLARPLKSEAPTSGKSFQYRIVQMNQVVEEANNTRPFTILKVLGPGSVLLDRSMTAEAEDGARTFEYKIVRAGVPNGPVWVSYRALRTDLNTTVLEVGADADGGVNSIVNQLGTLSEKNPLCLAAVAAAANTTQAIAVVGVSHWNLEGVAAALEVLGSSNVYSIVPLTQESSLLQLVQAHVDEYSDPNSYSGLERRCYFSMRYPFQETVIDTQTAVDNDLAVQAERDKVKLGTNATVNFAEVKPGYIVDFDPDGTGRTVAFDVGGAKVLRSQMEIASQLGTNEIRLLEEVHVDEGSSIAGPWRILTHVYSKDEVARNVAATSAAFGDRRITNFFPADVKVSINGTEKVVPTYIYAAARAALRSAVKANKPLTNAPVAGFVGTYGGQGQFSENQFSVMAGGGTDVLIQDSNNGPVTSRHQLTTDVSTVQRREESLCTGADYGAKFIRLGLRAIIGRFNLTDKFIKQEVRPRVEGLLAALVAEEIFSPDAGIKELGRHPQKPDGLKIVIRAPQDKPNNFDDIVLLLS